MKRITKKLMAAFLAVVMTLSLSVGAFAVATPTPTPTPVPGASADQTTHTNTSDPQSGLQSVTTHGEATFEGVDPNALYRVVLPTTSSYVGNMILDPNELIKKTEAAAYYGYDFDYDNTHLFFKNVTETASQLQRQIPVLQVLDPEQPDVETMAYVTAKKYERADTSVYKLTESYTDAYVVVEDASASSIWTGYGVATAPTDPVSVTAGSVNSLPFTVYVVGTDVYVADSTITAIDSGVTDVGKVVAASTISLDACGYVASATTTAVLLASDVNDSGTTGTLEANEYTATDIKTATEYKLQLWAFFSDNDTLADGPYAKPDFDAQFETGGNYVGYKLTGDPVTINASGKKLDTKTVDLYRKIDVIGFEDNKGNTTVPTVAADTSVIPNLPAASFDRDIALSRFGYTLSDGSLDEDDPTAVTSVYYKDAGTTEIFFVPSSGYTTANPIGTFYKSDGTYTIGEYTGVAKYVEYHDEYNLDANGVGATYDTVAKAQAAKVSMAQLETDKGFVEAKGDSVSYSGTSDRMTIINKSNRDLGVTVDVKVNKSSDNMSDTGRITAAQAQDTKFFFVGSKGALETATKPSMYLALISGDDTAVIKDPNYLSPDEENDNGLRAMQVDIEVPETEIKAGTNVKDCISDVSITWGDSIADTAKAINDEKDAFNTAITGKKISVAYNYAVSGEEVTKSFTVSTDITGTYTTDLTTESSVVAINDNAADPLTFNIVKGETTIATVVLTLDASVVKDETTSYTAAQCDYVEFTQWVPRSTATMNQSIPQYKDAFKMVVYQTITSSGDQAKKYEYQLKSDYVGQDNNGDFDSVSFQLTGDINPTSDTVTWDALDPFGIDLIFDLHDYEAGVDKALPEAAGPSVKVLTAGSTSTDTVLLSYSLGSGSLKGKAPANSAAIYYTKITSSSTTPNSKLSSGVTVTPADETSGTISVKLPGAVPSAAKDFYVQFLTRAGEATESMRVTFDPTTVTP